MVHDSVAVDVPLGVEASAPLEAASQDEGVKNVDVPVAVDVLDADQRWGGGRRDIGSLQGIAKPNDQYDGRGECAELTPSANPAPGLDGLTLSPGHLGNLLFHLGSHGERRLIQIAKVFRQMRGQARLDGSFGMAVAFGHGYRMLSERWWGEIYGQRFFSENSGA
jgi:hypothetical protein